MNLAKLISIITKMQGYFWLNIWKHPTPVVAQVGTRTMGSGLKATVILSVTSQY